mgnify:CR=1 FL=1
MDNLLNQSGSRSSFIEQALLEYIQHHKKLMRDHKDLELINAHAEEMNEEADDILSFQVEFWKEATCLEYTKQQKQIQKIFVFLPWSAGKFWSTQNSQRSSALWYIQILQGSRLKYR